MILTAGELAEVLRHGVVKETAGEARASEVKKTQFVTPPVYTFTVDTVEGAKFTVSVHD